MQSDRNFKITLGGFSGAGQMLMSTLQDGPANSWMAGPTQSKALKSAISALFFCHAHLKAEILVKNSENDFLIGEQLQTQGAERRRVTH